MESNRSLNEAILRSHQSTEKGTQAQEQLYNMTRPEQHINQPHVNQQQVPLNESHKNLMQSWMNLRQMDNAIADKLEDDAVNKNTNLPENEHKTI